MSDLTITLPDSILGDTDYLPILKLTGLVGQAFMRLQCAPEIIEKGDPRNTFEEFQEAHQRIVKILYAIDKARKAEA